METMNHAPAREWLTVDEWRRRNLVGRDVTYRLVQRGELMHVRVGKRVLIASDALDQLATRQKGTVRRDG